MSEVLEMGKISARGQIAIPVAIRKEMGLEEGSKVMFFLEDDTLLIKKVSAQTWEQITAPLRQAKKKIKQEDVDGLIHRMRKA
ncbi:MAG: AbrB/MazE/SpoVT family DNA-binding domain-containing protein [Candidatus Burarchaeum sp.]|nr:AbrB/MazE/SpoVT family DNA-binding domain-containing protein [Candidatus Burarchaeum sp.]MDO8339595.1 AbrB/MazE/SpoVT family DNA-binding domain-containing protein [Candidatus Burarchaeum sp.]